MAETLESQIDRLAKAVLEVDLGEPCGDEGAVDAAIHLMRRVPLALRELGVPGEGYPAPVALAVDILRGSDFIEEPLSAIDFRSSPDARPVKPTPTPPRA